jgi:tryptophanyl-tRNA synthetase
MSHLFDFPKKIILTGDRPTGPLHLGHFVGSLKNRVFFQEKYEQFLMIADLQAMTDNFENPEKIFENIKEVLLDYLACGIEPQKTKIFLQSEIGELAELTMIFMNFVGLGRLFRNPTLKTEIKQKNFCEDFFGEKNDNKESLKMGFLAYPISQASDISLFLADLVPVGEDQIPMIEQTNEITQKFNSIYKTDFFKRVKAFVGQEGSGCGAQKTGRLVGLDGKAKMSKSLNNAIFLKDSNDEIARKIKSAYTDPNHIKVSDPGVVEGNVVFDYLDVFYDDKNDIECLKENYRAGGLGDSVLKKKLTEILVNLIEPIRKKREEFEKEPDFLRKVLSDGNFAAKKRAAENFAKIKEIMGYTKGII